MSETAILRSIAFFRVALGAWLVWAALPNLDYGFVESLPVTLEQYAQTNPIEWYRWVLHFLAIPHAEMLGKVISVGQFLLGCSIAIGFFTRFTAGLVGLFVINLLLAAGHTGFYVQGFCILLLLMLVTCLFADAGRYYGLDGFLFREVSETKSSKKPKFKKKQQAAVDELARQLGGSKKRGAKSPVG